MSFLVLVLCVAAVSAFPTKDIVISKFDEPRFQYTLDGAGDAVLVDTWLKTSDLRNLGRYNPDVENVYHLFTRQNPTVSQPLLLGAAGLLSGSNFDPTRRTVVTMHGWQYDASSDFNQVLVPALLEAEDVNVIAVDWSGASLNPNYLAVITVHIAAAGESIARFITWLNSSTGASLPQYHVVGYSVSGQTCGLVGRNLNGQIPHITSLDPAGPGFVLNPNAFLADDGLYTEMIHTDILLRGVVRPLAQVSFYPNGGALMPGCDAISECNHERSFYYFAESVRAGGFTGNRCDSFDQALAGNCEGETLRMGGLTAKTGASGIYYVATNAASPFSLDYLKNKYNK